MENLTGGTPPVRYLPCVVPCKLYFVYDEIIVPACAKEQLDGLIKQGILEVVDENSLNSLEKIVYRGAYQSLAQVMINPQKPKKNRGETCSLAMAKTKSIPYFATDEMDLQPIIDRILNTGIGSDIYCIRIKDIILRMKSGELEGFKRKEAKVLWRLSGKNSDIFDSEIWVADTY